MTNIICSESNTRSLVQAPSAACLSLRIPRLAWDITLLRQLVLPGASPTLVHTAQGCRDNVDILLGTEHWLETAPYGWELDPTGVEALREQGARTRRWLSALGVPHMIAFEDGDGGAPEIDGFALNGALTEGGRRGATRLASDALTFSASLGNPVCKNFIEALAGLLAWTTPFGPVSTQAGLTWQSRAPAWSDCEWNGHDALGWLASQGWPDPSSFAILAQIMDSALAQNPAELKLARSAFHAWCVSEEGAGHEVSWRAARFAHQALCQHPELAFKLPARAHAFFDFPLAQSPSTLHGIGSLMAHEGALAAVESQWLLVQSLISAKDIPARPSRLSL